MWYFKPKMVIGAENRLAFIHLGKEEKKTKYTVVPFQEYIHNLFFNNNYNNKKELSKSKYIIKGKKVFLWWTEHATKFYNRDLLGNKKS